MTTRPDIATVNHLLALRMSALVREIAGEPSGRSRTTLRLRRKGSLAVEVKLALARGRAWDGRRLALW